MAPPSRTRGCKQDSVILTRGCAFTGVSVGTQRTLAGTGGLSPKTQEGDGLRVATTIWKEEMKLEH